MVVLLGALYALLFALSRVRRMPRLMPLAYSAYAGLIISALLLARATHMFNTVTWTVILMCLLVGYLMAPHAVWHLCVKTRAAAHEQHDVGSKDSES